ncbi:DinB family protein [Marinicrinis lubricantis]
MDLAERRAWNDNHKRLTEIITKPNEHDLTVDLFLTHHAMLHSSKMIQGGIPTLEDAVLENLDEMVFREYPVNAPDTKNSIAWHLWHIARIEDMTMNVLIADDQQVLYTGNWLERLNIRFPHSGNSMNDEHISELSARIDMNALFAYRIAVGKQTRKVVSSLQSGEFKEKVQASRIQRLFVEHALLPEARGIADYWSKKTVAGLVLMPATRHNFLHLNKCVRIKQKVQKGTRNPLQS